MDANNFVSYFKIDGKPIPPPVMTIEKREEMKRLRERAVLIESNIKRRKEAELKSNSEADLNLQRKLSTLERTPNQTLSLQCSEDDSESTTDNEYLRVSNLYRQPLVKKDVHMPSSASSAQFSLAHLQKSDTFIYDVVTNTLTNSCNDEDYNELSRSTSNSSIISMISNTTSAQNSVPTPTISPPPSTPTKDHDDKSNSIKFSADSPLNRSKSFTLERPSTVLLKHINLLKTVQRRKSTATTDIVEYKAKKIARSSVQASASSGNMPGLRNRKSPYETRTTKINRKKVLSSSKAVDPLKNVEETHRQKFLDLLKTQKEEQEAMQKYFEDQQQRLIDELNKVTVASKVVIKSSPTNSENSPAFRKSHSDCSELQKKIPRKKVFKSLSPDISSKQG